MVRSAHQHPLSPPPPSAGNHFEICENLNRDDNCPVKSTRKRLTNRSHLMRRNIDRRSTASDEEPLEEMSFRQLSSGSDQQQHKRHSTVAESILSCESEMSTTSTFLCSNQSEVSHVPVSTTTASTPANDSGCGGGVGVSVVPVGMSVSATVSAAAVAAAKERNKDLGTSRTPNESDEDNATHKHQHQRRHAINITSNPGYQVSGQLRDSCTRGTDKSFCE